MAKTIPSSYITGIIIFTLIVVGGVSFVAFGTGSNPSFGTSQFSNDFNSSFNKLNDVNTEVGEIEDSIKESSPDAGAFGMLNALISSGWQTLKLLFDSFEFMETTIGELELFGVPAWIMGLIGLMISVMIAFAIFSGIFQREM
jgi:hypothetical protein